MGGRIDNIHQSSIRIQGTEGHFDAHVFKDKELKSYCGTIILINGFSVYGQDDPRMIHLARAFAKVGFIIILPSFSDLNRLHIHPRVIAQIADCIHAVTLDNLLCPERRVALLAPSYAGGMTLKAILLPHIRGNISAVLLIGTFFDMDRSMRYLLSNPSADDYGRNILLLNFLPYIETHHEELIPILQMAIDDNGFKKRVPQLPLLLKRSHPEVVSQWLKIKYDKDWRMSLFENALKSFPHSSAWQQQFDVIPDLPYLGAPIFLLHGKNDNVIPSSESLDLYAHLKAINKKAFICITPLIDHGDIQQNPFRYLGGISLYHLFNRFINQVSLN